MVIAASNASGNCINERINCQVDFRTVGNLLGLTSNTLVIPASLRELVLSNNGIGRTYLEELLHDSSVNAPLSLEVYTIYDNI